MIVMTLLQVIATTMCHGIEPFTHEMMTGSTSFPIPLIAVIGTKDDEEGHGGNKHSDAIGVVEDFVLFAIIIVCYEKGFKDDIEDSGDYAWDGGSPDRGTVYTENEAQIEE